MQAVTPACTRLAPGVPARPALRPAVLVRPRLVSRAASGQEPAQWEKAAAADAELQSRISEAVDVAETEARSRAFRERFKSAAAADLRPRPPPPLPLATPPPPGPTSAPGGWRPAPLTPQDSPELPTRTLRAATNAALLLLPITAAAAAAAAAAASRPAAALRTLLLLVTGAAGLALSLALVTMSLAAAALLAHAAWRLFLGAPRAASPRAAAAADAVSDGAEETVRRFMRTRRAPPAAPAAAAAAAAPPAPALALALAPVDLEELLRRLVSALRWSALPFLGLSVLAAATTAPQALERAAAALFAASFGVASSLALLAAAMAGSAALVSRAAGSLRQLLAPDDTPQLRLPQLWQPALAQPPEDEATPYAPAALPAPWTPPAAEQGPGGEQQQQLDVPAPAERSLPRFRARSDEPASLEEMRARAKEVYWANKNWKETLANPAPTQKRASRPRPGATAPMSADEAALESRRDARAAWAQRVKRAQGQQ